MSQARDKIGDFYNLNMGGTAYIGQLDYTEPSPMPSFLPIGGSLTEYTPAYISEGDPAYYTLQGAIGAWSDSQPLPTSVNLLRYLSAAGNYSEVLSPYSAGSIANSLMTGEEIYNANHSDTWSDFKIRVQSKISWLWGSLEDGGCGVIKYNSTQVSFIGAYGVYNNENGTDERIAATEYGPYNMALFAGENIFAVYHWKERDTYSGSIEIVAPIGSEVRYFDSPTVPPLYSWLLRWIEHYGALSNTLDNTLYTDAGDGTPVHNTLFSLTTVTSPYNNEVLIFTPGTEINIEGYSQTHGDEDNGLGENQYDRGADSGDKDGDGDYDLDSEDVEGVDESQFAVDAQSCGFVTVYKPDKSTLQTFGNWLYGTMPTTYGSFLENIKKLQLNPMDGIISLNISHFSAATSGSQDISFYGQASGISAPVVSKLTHVKECGSISVNELIGGWMSYNDNVKLKAYIPYCGCFDISTNLVMGGTLKLKYIIDVLSGACVAEIMCDRPSRRDIIEDSYESPVYRFTGNVFQQVPISAVDYSGIIQGQLGLAAGAASIATGNIIGGLSSSINAMTAHPSVSTIGSYGASYGYMSDQVPFLIYEYPCYNMPESYEAYYGEPIYDFKQIGSCQGLIYIDGDTFWGTDPGDGDFIDMTSEEEELLKQAIKEGLYMPRTNTDYSRKSYDPTA